MSSSMPPELTKAYDSQSAESEVSARWLEAGVFSAKPDARSRAKRYVVMMPLPNVTGALHMGHAMDNVMQDLLVRWHRQRGFNTLWMPGSDHAGIATQAVIEKRLKELEGKTRHDIGKEALVERIWAWKDHYQERIIRQQQRLGCSCDWWRHRFTMDAVCARAVRHAFMRLFDDGLIYRGKRLVNWDVALQTSISDDEIYHQRVKGNFWHLRYPVVAPQPGEPPWVVVATTRPETMLGDTAVAVHPDPAQALAAVIDSLRRAKEKASAKDSALVAAQLEEMEARRRDLLPGLVSLRDMARAGRCLRLPLTDRKIPLILDRWPKPELGSGCVKITPAHDLNDYAVWQRHKHEIGLIKIINPDGTLNQMAGPYEGLDRYEARKQIVADLEAAGLVDHIEDREIDVGHSDRSKSPIEPLISDQWYIRMGDIPGGIEMGRATAHQHRSPGLVQAAMDAVISGEVAMHPKRYERTCLDWLAEKRDWPISRQLWWGHQIPIWSRQGSWGVLKEEALAPLFQLNRALLSKEERLVAEKLSCASKTPGIVIRVNRPTIDDGETIAVGPNGALAGSEPDHSELIALDICLLEDDKGVISALEALGFVRDEDVLDTWFSSALWPFSSLGWPGTQSATMDNQRPSSESSVTDGQENSLSYYYPGSCLVTGRDIITLWVARMVLAGIYFRGQAPFTDVFIHANILDGNGERMSKSKGNGIDPVDISEVYGTDAMRYVLCDMQTGTQDIRLPVTAICPACNAHNDLSQTKTGENIFIRICSACSAAFDVLGTVETHPAATLISERFEVGRAFCTKLWNSMRFALMNIEAGLCEAEKGASAELEPIAFEDLAIEDRWLLDALNEAIRAVDNGLAGYHPSAALAVAREFFWNVLCDWYLEIIKPRLAEADLAVSEKNAESLHSARVARRVLAYTMDQVLRLFHPFIPFITEKLWYELGRRMPRRDLGPMALAPASDLLAIAAWPTPQNRFDDKVLRAKFAELQALTRAVRDLRTTHGISPHTPLEITIKIDAQDYALFSDRIHILRHLANIASVDIDKEKVRETGTAVVRAAGIEVLVHHAVDDAAEAKRVRVKHARLVKEIAACTRKLENSAFIERAPAEVIEQQRARKAAYQADLDAVERSLTALGED